MKDYMEDGLKTLKERGKICVTGTDYSTGRRNDTIFIKLQTDFFFSLLIQLSYMASRERKKSQYKLKPPERVSKQP